MQAQVLCGAYQSSRISQGRIIRSCAAVLREQIEAAQPPVKLLCDYYGFQAEASMYLQIIEHARRFM